MRHRAPRRFFRAANKQGIYTAANSQELGVKNRATPPTSLFDGSLQLALMTQRMAQGLCRQAAAFAWVQALAYSAWPHPHDRRVGDSFHCCPAPCGTARPCGDSYGAACRATPGAAWTPAGQALYHARGANCSLSPARACYPHLPGNGTRATMHSARTAWTDAPVSSVRAAVRTCSMRTGVAAGFMRCDMHRCTLLPGRAPQWLTSSGKLLLVPCSCSKLIVRLSLPGLLAIARVSAGMISCFGCMRRHRPVNRHCAGFAPLSASCFIDFIALAACPAAARHLIPSSRPARSSWRPAQA